MVEEAVQIADDLLCEDDFTLNSAVAAAVLCVIEQATYRIDARGWCVLEKNGRVITCLPPHGSG
jgi:hypothetical protein